MFRSPLPFKKHLCSSGSRPALPTLRLVDFWELKSTSLKVAKPLPSFQPCFLLEKSWQFRRYFTITTASNLLPLSLRIAQKHVSHHISHIAHESRAAVTGERSALAFPLIKILWVLVKVFFVISVRSFLMGPSTLCDPSQERRRPQIYSPLPKFIFHPRLASNLHLGGWVDTIVGLLKRKPRWMLVALLAASNGAVAAGSASCFGLHSFATLASAGRRYGALCISAPPPAPSSKQLSSETGLLCMLPSRTLLSLTIFHPVNPLSSFPRKAHSSLVFSPRTFHSPREARQSRCAYCASAGFPQDSKAASTAYQLTLPPAPACACMDSSIEGARLPSQTVHARVTHCRYEATNQRSLFVVHSLTRFPSSIFFRRAKKGQEPIRMPEAKKNEIRGERREYIAGATVDTLKAVRWFMRRCRQACFVQCEVNRRGVWVLGAEEAGAGAPLLSSPAVIAARPGKSQNVGRFGVIAVVEHCLRWGGGRSYGRTADTLRPVEKERAEVRFPHALVSALSVDFRIQTDADCFSRRHSGRGGGKEQKNTVCGWERGGPRVKFRCCSNRVVAVTRATFEARNVTAPRLAFFGGAGWKSGAVCVRRGCLGKKVSGGRLCKDHT
ncbi:hypothetical protein L345_07904, partial [Ophiophagus hannah]